MANWHPLGLSDDLGCCRHQGLRFQASPGSLGIALTSMLATPVKLAQIKPLVMHHPTRSINRDAGDIHEIYNYLPVAKT